MRALALLLTLLAGLVAAAIVALPRWIDTPAGREALLQALSEYAGAPVAVEGAVEFGLLPRPAFTLARLRVGGGAGARPTGLTGQVDRIDVELAPAELLRGRFVVARLRVVRPDLVLYGGRERLLGLLAATADAPVRAAEVIGGRLRVRAADEPELVLEELDLLLRSAAPEAPKTVEARARLDGRRIRLGLEAGPARPGRRTPFGIRLAVGPGGEAGELVFTGLVGGPDSLSGEVSAALSDAGALAAFATLAALPPPVGEETSQRLLPLSLRAEIERDGPRVGLADGRLALPAGRLRFSGSLRTGEVPTVDLDLRADDWSLDAEPLLALAARTLWRPPAVRLAGGIRLAADRLRLSGRTIDGLRGRLQADGTGGLRLEDFEAALPAGGRVEFDVSLHPRPGTGTARLDLSVVLPTLHETLAGWGLTADDLPAGVPRSLSGELALRTAGNTLRLERLDLVADATRLSAEGLWRSAPAPRLELAVQATRPDLDPWLLLLRRNLDEPGRLAGLPAGTEAVVGLSLEKPSLASVRAGQAELDVVLREGVVRVEDFHLADLAGADLRGSGEFDPASGAWDVSATGAVPSPGRLLRLFGVPADPLVLALGPLEAQLRLGRRGRLFDADLSLESAHLSATGTFRGTTPGPAGLVSADLRLDVPSLAQLARAAGVPLVVPVGTETPVGVRLALTRTGAGVIATAGHGRIADREWTLDGEWRQSPDRLPEWAGRLRVSRLPATPVLDVLYRLAAPIAGWLPVAPWHWPGAWPATPVGELGSRAFAVDLELVAEEDDGAFRLLSAPGHLTLEGLRWPLAEGRMTGELALVLEDGLLAAAGRLGFEDVEAGALLAAGGSEPPLAGRLGLDVEFRGRVRRRRCRRRAPSTACCSAASAARCGCGTGTSLRSPGLCRS